MRFAPKRRRVSRSESRALGAGQRPRPNSDGSRRKLVVQNQPFMRLPRLRTIHRLALTPLGDGHSLV